MLLIAAAFVATAAPAASAPAHLSPPAAQTSPSERMAPLAPLIGEWRGSGWTLMPDGSRSEFQSREIVTPRLSGNALLVEGKHYSPGNPDRLVHDAIGLITWDPRASAYRFRTSLANGMSGDYPLEVSPGRFAWRIDTPGGRIDYVAEFTSESWVERGRRTAADGRSVDFFEMRLQRAR